MFSIAIIARNRVEFDNLASLRRRVRRSRRETRDSQRKQESEARRRVVARAAAAGHNRFDELNSSPCRNDVDAAASEHLSSVGRAAALNLTGARRTRSSDAVRSGGFDHQNEETRTRAAGTGIWLKHLRSFFALYTGHVGLVVLHPHLSR
jgi:hypothetical protein